MLNALIGIELGLFIYGFIYGSLLGSERMHPLLRGFYGGLFFAFFYVAIPGVYIQERLENKK